MPSTSNSCLVWASTKLFAELAVPDPDSPVLRFEVVIINIHQVDSQYSKVPLRKKNFRLQVQPTKVYRFNGYLSVYKGLNVERP
jgi:hypothetical protein